MKITEVFNKKLRHSKDGVNVVGDIKAVVSVNMDERRTHSRVSSHQRSRIEQRGGKTGEDDTEPESPISPNLAAPVDAAVAFRETKDD